MLRLSIPWSEALPVIRREIAAVDDEAPVFDASDMENLVDRSLGEPRFRSYLIGTFAFLALLLATVGIFGIVADETRRSFHEMAVRRTLGALPQDILRLQLRRGFLFVLVGLAMGLPGAMALSWHVSSVLYQVHPLDPYSYLLAFSVFGIVGLGACLLPALQTFRVDLVSTLRQE